MGRGRQKAKNMKVARRLKYAGPDTDLSALQRELAGDGGSAGADAAADEASEDKYWDD